MLEFPVIERRQKRSPWASQALQFQLQQITQEFQLDSLILTDSKGNLWAASSIDPVSGHLAQKVASIGVLGGGKGFTVVQDKGKTISVSRINVGQAHLFLAAHGAQRQADLAIEMAVPGVERILHGLLLDDPQ